jgi:hypothetical protein
MIKMRKEKHHYGSQLKTHKISFPHSCGKIKILCIHLLIYKAKIFTYSTQSGTIYCCLLQVTAVTRHNQSVYHYI